MAKITRRHCTKIKNCSWFRVAKWFVEFNDLLSNHENYESMLESCENYSPWDKGIFWFSGRHILSFAVISPEFSLQVFQFKWWFHDSVNWTVACSWMHHLTWMNHRIMKHFFFWKKERVATDNLMWNALDNTYSNVKMVLLLFNDSLLA